ncbi:MAG: response regulator [Fimbriimonas sp.]
MSTLSESPKALVCDDERHIARLLQVQLERRGYAVTCAYDGNEAVEMLQREHFDRVLVDLMMPYRDGYEVLQWIRTHDETKDTWVALMTANADELRTWTDMPYQADAYLSKPFNPAELPN